MSKIPFFLRCSKKNEIDKDQLPRNSFIIINLSQKRKSTGKEVAQEKPEVNSTILSPHYEPETFLAMN